VVRPLYGSLGVKGLSAQSVPGNRVSLNGSRSNDDGV